MAKTIVIIGGNGAMGQLFQHYWQNFTVLTLDKTDWDNAETLLSQADLIVISVPINQTLQAIESAAPYIPNNCILLDFTSIKDQPITSMLNHHSGSVIGLHPMFGPTIKSPTNQVIINCGGRNLGNCAWVFESLTALGFRITEMTATKHDEIMGFIQGIEHFSTFALGDFLKKQNMHPEEIFDIASPIYQTKLALMGRIFDQDAKLYADIVMSDELRIKLIIQYIDYLQSFKELLLNQDKQSFTTLFSEISQWMGKFTSTSQAATDELLNSMPSIYKKS